MCVIIHFEPNAEMNKNHLFNAVYNNWNGFGLVLKDANGHLEVIKEYDSNGNDPERIWKLLEDNKDVERFLHVRFTTKGASNEENTQPFEVFNSSKRRVIFMHNGTLHSFGSTYNHQHGVSNSKSDTLDFCEKILSPALLRWTGENGKADYTDPEFFKLVIDKQWTSGSKGLFVSNDLRPLRIGPENDSNWRLYDKETDGPKIWVSNNDYFYEVKRGPEHERRQKEEQARKEAEKKSVQTFQGDNSNTSNTSGIKEFRPENLNKDPDILRAINTIMDKFDFDNDLDLANLENLTYNEWDDFVRLECPWTLAAFLELFAQRYATLYRKYQREALTKQRATLRLENIAKNHPEIVETSNAA